MKKTYELGDCAVESFTAPVTSDWTSLFGQAAGAASGKNSLSAEAIEQLLDLNGKFAFSYLCPIDK